MDPLPFAPILLSVLIPGAPAPGADWAPSLCLNGGGLWRQRIPVTLRNGLPRDAAGDPVPVPIGIGDGELALAGQRSEAVRVVGAASRELLFRIEDPRGLRIDGGPIAEGSVLVIPAEGAAGSGSRPTATCASTHPTRPSSASCRTMPSPTAPRPTSSGGWTG